MLTETSARGYTAGKRQLRNRLHRIEGQVRGIERMVDEDRYCIDVITHKVALSILDAHTRHCVASHPTDEVTDELMAAVARLMRRG